MFDSCKLLKSSFKVISFTVFLGACTSLTENVPDKFGQLREVNSIAGMHELCLVSGDLQAKLKLDSDAFQRFIVGTKLIDFDGSVRTRVSVYRDKIAQAIGKDNVEIFAKMEEKDKQKAITCINRYSVERVYILGYATREDFDFALCLFEISQMGRSRYCPRENIKKDDKVTEKVTQIDPLPVKINIVNIEDNPNKFGCKNVDSDGGYCEVCYSQKNDSILDNVKEGYDRFGSYNCRNLKIGSYFEIRINAKASTPMPSSTQGRLNLELREGDNPPHASSCAFVFEGSKPKNIEMFLVGSLVKSYLNPGLKVTACSGNPGCEMNGQIVLKTISNERYRRLNKILTGDTGGCVGGSKA